MTATDAQIRIVMKERHRGRTQEQAAAKANLWSRQTVAKYEQLGQLPSVSKQRRSYRTRENPFVEDWLLIEKMLTEAPELEAKALFEWLSERRPNRYQAGQLRTFQRHVSQWRGQNQSQVASLEQIRQPGEQLQTDGTWLNELGITIQGEAFEHMLIHCVLPYSNWEWGRIAPTESLPALRLALQSTLQKLGAVPLYHQTDHSSAATKQLGVQEKGKEVADRTYTEGYLQLLAHFGLQPSVTHVRSPDENGDVEAAHGSLKRSLKQQLLLRGSKEFDSLATYEAFVWGVMDRRNQLRQERLAEELKVMKPLSEGELVTYTEQRVRVGPTSIVRVLKNSYSVPTRLIGRQIVVRIGVWELEFYYGSHHVETVPRLIGQQKQHINYHHIIGSLLRKPGGFRNYRYREALFPRQLFRQAWEQLNQWYAPRRADLIYLQVLNLAAQTWESEVATALELLLERQEKWSDEDVIQLIDTVTPQLPLLQQPVIQLSLYDSLLAEVCHVRA
jgi:hypothetical protein